MESSKLVNNNKGGGKDIAMKIHKFEPRMDGGKSSQQKYNKWTETLCMNKIDHKHPTVCIH
jgi:hypothetical protein